MKLLMYLALALAAVCALFVLVTKIWIHLWHAMVLLAFVFVIAAAIFVLYRARKETP